MAMEGIFGEGVDRVGGQPISARMARRAPMRHLDPTLLLATFLTSAFGAAMIFSATVFRQLESGADPDLFLKRQVGYLVAGLIALVVGSLFDYRVMRGFAPILYGGTLLGLVVVLTPLGTVSKGAARWIDIGPVQIQPSELSKVAIIVALATYLSERKGDLTARDIFVSCAIVALPAALIYLEPDLGTMLVLVAITAALLLVGGAKIRHFVALGIVGAAAIGLILQGGLLKDYQMQRLTSFLDPNPDVRSYGYNLVQSKIAIGSGGLRGKGFRGENTQTSLDFVPEQHTDFIFTAVGEQLGFVGSAALLALFAFLIWRAIRIAAMSRDAFGTLIAAGIASFWAFQVFVNVGMTMGIMPITGIPLPFMSYGGSATIASFAAAGLVLNVHMRRFS